MRKIAAVLILSLCAVAAHAQVVVNFAFTNSLAQPDTNFFRVIPVGSPILANGGVITRGPGIIVTPNTQGKSSLTLLKGNYQATNFVLGQGIVFAVPDSGGPYFINDLAISGYNTYNYSPGVLSMLSGSTNVSVSVSGRVATIDTPYAATTNFANNIATNAATAYGMAATQDASMDTNAAIYCDHIGITSPADRQRISGFVTTLKKANLWTNLVDCAFMRPQYCGSSLVTFYGGIGTNINGATFTSDGISLNGTTHLIIWPVPQVTSNTVIVGLRGSTNEPVAGGAPWTLCANGGVSVSGEAALFLNNSGAIAQLYSRQGGGAAVNTLFWDSITNQGWHSNDPRFRSVGVTYDGSTAFYPYCEGAMGTGLTQAPQITSPMNELALGGRYINTGTTDLPYKGTYSEWLVFNKALTTNDAVQVELAMRWLYPSDENMVIIGDSMSAFNYGWPGYDWPSQYEWSNNGTNNKVRLYNLAFTGTTAAQWSTYVTNALFLQPGGPVKKSTAYVWLGMNDLYVGGSGPDTLQNITNNLISTWNQLAQSNFVVSAATIHSVWSNSILTWIPAMENMKSNLNNWIITNKTYYSTLRRIDALFSDWDVNTNNANTVTRDGLHPNVLGASRIAYALQQNGAAVQLPSGAAFLPDTNRYAFDGSTCIASNGAFYYRNAGVWVPAVPPTPGANQVLLSGSTLAGNSWAASVPAVSTINGTGGAKVADLYLTNAIYTATNPITANTLDASHESTVTNCSANPTFSGIANVPNGLDFHTKVLILANGADRTVSLTAPNVHLSPQGSLVATNGSAAILSVNGIGGIWTNAIFKPFP